MQTDIFLCSVFVQDLQVMASMNLSYSVKTNLPDIGNLPDIYPLSLNKARDKTANWTTETKRFRPTPI